MQPKFECHTHVVSRRHALKMTLLGGGAIIGGLAVTAPARAGGGGAEALLLSCMDYRLVDDIVRYMDGRRLTNNYDHVVLAGAALGATSDKFPGWNATFWEHLDVAIKLHHIKKVIVLDHRDCGAYRIVLDKNLTGDEEKAAHAERMNTLATTITQKYPDLAVELLLMDLDGAVEPIARG